MAHWNYRVIEFLDPSEGPWKAIHEVHYDEHGRPASYSDSPACVVSCDDGGNERDLAWVLDRMREALDRPTLRESDFGPHIVRAGGDDHANR